MDIKDNNINNKTELSKIKSSEHLKILVIFAHPALHLSRINKALIKAYEGIEGLTFHDLYETYPRFFIDISHEQKLLREHDLIIFHYPLHWYNFPPLLKHWQDMVLTTDFVLSKQNRALENKYLINVLSTGGSKHSYNNDGCNNYEISDYLIHVEQTARVCKMKYLPPYVVHDARAIKSNSELSKQASYLQLVIKSLQYMSADELLSLSKKQYINQDMTPFMLTDSAWEQS